MPEPNQHPETRAGRLPPWWPAAVVWGLWGGILLAAFSYTAAYGCNVPRWDDFLIVPYLTLTELISTGWIWEQHDAHRLIYGLMLKCSRWRKGRRRLIAMPAS